MPTLPMNVGFQLLVNATDPFSKPFLEQTVVRRPDRLAIAGDGRSRRAARDLRLRRSRAYRCPSGAMAGPLRLCLHEIWRHCCAAVFGILPPIKREALTMKVEWPAFTVERWPNHSPDQLRLQQAPPRGNLGYSITSSARDPGDPRCSALAANRPFAMDIRGVPHHGRQTDVEPGASRDGLPQALSTYSSFSSRLMRLLAALECGDCRLRNPRL